MCQALGCTNSTTAIFLPPSPPSFLYFLSHTHTRQVAPYLTSFRLSCSLSHTYCTNRARLLPLLPLPSPLPFACQSAAASWLCVCVCVWKEEEDEYSNERERRKKGACTARHTPGFSYIRERWGVKGKLDLSLDAKDNFAEQELLEACPRTDSNRTGKRK